MAIFDTGIIPLEGGYSNDPNDHGGETKYGITAADNPGVDIKNLTVQQAIEIYKRKYWDPNNLTCINNQTTANLIFRLIVNAGPQHAIKIVQNAINTMNVTIAVDGILGPTTYKTINVLDNDWLIDAVRVSEAKFYLAITDHDESQIKFFRGWIRRALS